MSGTRKFAKIALGLALFVPAVLGIGCRAAPHTSKATVRTESGDATGAARAGAPTAALSSFTVTWPQHDPTLPEPHLGTNCPTSFSDISAFGSSMTNSASTECPTRRVPFQGRFPFDVGMNCDRRLEDYRGAIWPRLVFGEPIYADDDSAHNIVRQYGAFTVYYDDQVLAPRWTAIKVTREMADANSGFRRPGNFKTDSVLTSAGLQTTTHGDYNNLPGSRKWDRGHMVQFNDVRGYGDQAGRDSMFTSNVCPQLAAHNRLGWLTLEETCTEFARNFDVIWVFTDPIYNDNPQPFEPGRIVPAPIAFYKVVVSPAEDGGVDVLAFRTPHEPIPRGADVSQFLVSIDEIEDETGIDFLHELPDPLEDQLEETVWELWPDTP